MWGNPPPPQKDNRGKTLFNLQKLILKIGFIIYHDLLLYFLPFKSCAQQQTFVEPKDL